MLFIFLDGMKEFISRSDREIEIRYKLTRGMSGGFIIFCRFFVFGRFGFFLVRLDDLFLEGVVVF